MPDVVLVSMPFGALFSPSIGLSLLKAELTRHGIASTIEYFSIPFARTLGKRLYEAIASGDVPAFDDLVGEWLFARALFGRDPAADRRYINEILGQYPRRTVARILGARDHTEPFLDHCVETVLRHHPRVVGLTTTFQQHVASLALARRIKRARPSTFIVLGGANCEGVMGAETVRRFHCIDAAVSGEADAVFPKLVRRVLDGESISDLPGVRTRARLAAGRSPAGLENAPPVRDLDRLPFPDYSDYFAQFRATRYDRYWYPRLFIETSRGCWWAERVHCTFCGLNGATTTFRSKPARRTLEELAHMAARYPGSEIQAADNILDMRYFEEFLPELKARGPRVKLFLETKSNLKKDQVRLLRDAGVSEVQPGIESFSDPVLQIMRKGVTGLQNIQVLKWCRELGVQPCWNVLWGFPGEPAAEYERMARLVPLLTHLPPPAADGYMRLDRFSPIFIHADRYGLKDVKPLRAYNLIYRVPARAVANIASYFTFEYREPRDVEAYVQPLVVALQTWRRVANRSSLFSVRSGNRLIVWDLRPISTAPMVVLAGLEKMLYEACDAVCDAATLVRRAARSGYPEVSAADVEHALVPLLERGLMLRDGSRYLALAISLDEYRPSAEIVREFRRSAAKLSGTRDKKVIALTRRLVAQAARRSDLDERRR